MPRSSFARGVVFALVAGASAPMLALVLGMRNAGWAMLFAVIVHVLVVAPEVGRGVRASALATALAVPCVLLVRDRLVLTALALVILSLARSGVLHRRTFARALAVEVAFLAIGAASALLVFTPGWLGGAWMTWSFWLVQAAFAFLAESTTVAKEVPSDPFERAQRVAEAVLAGRPH